MITIIKEGNELVLVYTTDNDIQWFHEYFSIDSPIKLRDTFYFWEKDQIIDNNQVENESDIHFNKSKSVRFVLGLLDGQYYKIMSLKLGIKYDLYIYENVDVSIDFFITDYSIPIFKRLNNLIKEDIYIGGNKEKSISEEVYQEILNNFPTYYEVRSYVDSRISSVLKNYFDSAIDAESKYKKYMDKKVSQKGENLFDAFKETELIKYRNILDKLEDMLINESTYNEKQWQNEILEIVILLYPKYIAVLSNVQIKDIYNDKYRYLDYLLVDSSGHVDLIEIKQPFDNSIMTSTQYRDNYIPMRELSGTVMQIEKYVFYMKSWAKVGEKKMTEKYKDKLPDDFEIKIINPIGIIIMGRDISLTSKQLEDFEIVKRKYKNVADIITYDDLIRRLRNIIEHFRKQI